MYSYGPPHMAKQKQDDRLEHTYSSYVFANPAALQPEGRAEMVFLSDSNPRELAKVAAEW